MSRRDLFEGMLQVAQDRPGPAEQIPVSGAPSNGEQNNSARSCRRYRQSQ